jgi:hypothetical protein
LVIKAGQVAANNANFFGGYAGQGAVNAYNKFFGQQAGYGATGAYGSNGFLGQNAGLFAANCF